MTILRTDIEKALNELISNEEGMKFQGLAVILAKQKWPEFIASERKSDLGLDAYIPASLAQDGRGRGLACSLTATQSKIENDIKRFKPYFADVGILLFATPIKVSNQTANAWKDEIKKTHDIDLITISREDIINDLMQPSNISLCRSLLGLNVSVDPTVMELLTKAREASFELVKNWLTYSRLTERPIITLQLVKVNQDGQDTRETFTLTNLRESLLEGRRIILEAPAGRGKTTTLIQLAESCYEQGELSFLIDLPGWIISSSDILEYIAKMPAFRSRGINSEVLARLYEAVHFSFLLNGWNEISNNYSEMAVRALSNLERNFSRAGIIIATRTHQINPPLPGSFKTKLLTLNHSQRKEYLLQVLTHRADELISQLESDRVLDELTRTPMFLAEVTTIFQSTGFIPKTRMGVLGAVVRLVEQSDEHHNYLLQLPILGNSQNYLTELAIQMTINGDVTIKEIEARKIIHSVSQKLNLEGQIATLQEPSSILSTLCSHHVLERLEYPFVGFRFEHQQFQEYYAALVIKSQLRKLKVENDSNEIRQLRQEYINKPVWEEPLLMIAEEIGELTDESSNPTGAVVVGRRLIDLTLFIDPIFAADLARLCGSLVWNVVRESVGNCLRSWYQLKDVSHKQCAVAGMLASGSVDFIDIVLPLISSENMQVRLTTYRLWHEFHLSCLGPNWWSIVKGWNDELRVNFIGEVVNESWMADIAEEFALTDPSPKVRNASLNALQWVGAIEILDRVLSEFSDDILEQIIKDKVLYRIPPSSQQKVLLAYERLLQHEDNPISRLQILISMAKIDEQCTLEGIKEVLSKWSSEKKETFHHHHIIIEVLDLIKKTDPCWVSQWVAERIADGLLWGDSWEPFILSVSENFKQKLFEEICTVDLEQHKRQGILLVLTIIADAEIAKSVFLKLCEIRAEVLAVPIENKTTLWKISTQLEELFRNMSQSDAVSGLLSSKSLVFNPIEFDVTITLFGVRGTKESNLRSQIPDSLRQSLRKYLKEGIEFTLNQDDFNGKMKADLLWALARTGGTEDMVDLYRLILADIERLRKGRAARQRGDHSELTNGACMGWSTWNVQAVVELDSKACEEVLLKVLQEPEYERDSAMALIQLAKTQAPVKQIGFNKPDYSAIWDIRSHVKLYEFYEELRNRYVNAIKQRISIIMEQSSQDDKPSPLYERVKTLASAIAILDSHESADYVMEILVLPSEWDGWLRTETLRVLLFSGARLQADKVLPVLKPIIDKAKVSKFTDQQSMNYLTRCLCIFSFIDPPSIGLAQIDEILTTTYIPAYELKEIMTALGHCRCNDALDILLKLAIKIGKGFRTIAGDWIDAIYIFGTYESMQVLLSFIDPDIKQFEIYQYFDYHEREKLASYIADIARNDLAISKHLFLLCSRQLSSTTRHLLANILAHLGTSDALIAGLNLIHDNINPPIPQELIQGLENLFLEHKPYGNVGNSYTLEPRSANDIRYELFNMFLDDEDRRQSAMALLGQIELWRLEHGRPSDEPRHPAFDSGAPWPPIINQGEIQFVSYDTRGCSK